MFRYSNNNNNYMASGMCALTMSRFSLAFLFAHVALLSRCMVFRMSLNLVPGIVAVKICLASVLDQRNAHGSWLLLYNPPMMQGPITPMTPIAIISVL